MQFILDEVGKRGFVGCEKAMRNVFKFAGGDDVRVHTSRSEETKADSLKVTVISGKFNDAVVQEAEFRRVDRICVATQTSIVWEAKSCTSYLASNQTWKLEADTVGVISAKSPGGVSLTLMPVGTGCLQVFQLTIAE